MHGTRSVRSTTCNPGKPLQERGRLVNPPTAVFGYATRPWILVPASEYPFTKGISEAVPHQPGTSFFLLPRRCTATSPTDDASTTPAHATAKVSQGRSCPGSPSALGHGSKAMGKIAQKFIETRPLNCPKLLQIVVIYKKTMFFSNGNSRRIPQDEFNF